MVIRKAEAEDWESIYAIVQQAFERAEHTDGNEQDLVLLLKKSHAFIPALSLVSEADGKIVGYILFTKAAVGTTAVLALAPLAVLPEYQKRGIGTALIKEGHRIASELGYGYSVVLGSEKYYPRMGYLPAEQLGIKPPFAVPSENFMACRLQSNAPGICGIMKYAKEFGID